MRRRRKGTYMAGRVRPGVKKEVKGRARTERRIRAEKRVRRNSRKRAKSRRRENNIEDKDDDLDNA